MKRLYLAGPAGFSELASIGLQKLKEILSPFYDIIDPFLESQALGSEIITLQSSLIEKKSDKLENNRYAKVVARLQEVNFKIGENNAKFIQQADLVCAILDGADVDSGTAAEIGYAYGLGKRIYGYRGDFRISSDNLGSKINLQVEYFIHASGGQIFYSMAELRDHFTAAPP
jgi:nucleoside 2-deoxyribosyltransferase